MTTATVDLVPVHTATATPPLLEDQGESSDKRSAQQIFQEVNFDEQFWEIHIHECSQEIYDAYHKLFTSSLRVQKEINLLSMNARDHVLAATHDFITRFQIAVYNSLAKIKKTNETSVTEQYLNILLINQQTQPPQSPLQKLEKALKSYSKSPNHEQLQQLNQTIQDIKTQQDINPQLFDPLFEPLLTAIQTLRSDIPVEAATTSTQTTTTHTHVTIPEETVQLHAAAALESIGVATERTITRRDAIIQCLNTIQTLPLNSPAQRDQLLQQLQQLQQLEIQFDHEILETIQESGLTGIQFDQLKARLQELKKETEPSLRKQALNLLKNNYKIIIATLTKSADICTKCIKLAPWSTLKWFFDSFTSPNADNSALGYFMFSLFTPIIGFYGLGMAIYSAFQIKEEKKTDWLIAFLVNPIKNIVSSLWSILKWVFDVVKGLQALGIMAIGVGVISFFTNFIPVISLSVAILTFLFVLGDAVWRSYKEENKRKNFWSTTIAHNSLNIISALLSIFIAGITLGSALAASPITIIIITLPLFGLFTGVFIPLFQKKKSNDVTSLINDDITPLFNIATIMATLLVFLNYFFTLLDKSKDIYLPALPGGALVISLFSLVFNIINIMNLVHQKAHISTLMKIGYGINILTNFVTCIATLILLLGTLSIITAATPITAFSIILLICGLTSSLTTYFQKRGTKDVLTISDWLITNVLETRPGQFCYNLGSRAGLKVGQLCDTFAFTKIEEELPQVPTELEPTTAAAFTGLYAATSSHGVTQQQQLHHLPKDGVTQTTQLIEVGNPAGTPPTTTLTPSSSTDGTATLQSDDAHHFTETQPQTLATQPLQTTSTSL